MIDRELDSFLNSFVDINRQRMPEAVSLSSLKRVFHSKKRIKCLAILVFPIQLVHKYVVHFIGKIRTASECSNLTPRENAVLCRLFIYPGLRFNKK